MSDSTCPDFLGLLRSLHMTMDCSHMVLNIATLKTFMCTHSHRLLAPNTRNYAKTEDWSSQCFWTLPLLLVLWEFFTMSLITFTVIFVSRRSYRLMLFWKWLVCPPARRSSLNYSTEKNWKTGHLKKENQKDTRLEMAQWLWTLAILPEDISSDPSTHTDSQSL